MENVLMIRNVPTISAMAAKTSRNVLMPVRMEPIASSFFFASSSPSCASNCEGRTAFAAAVSCAWETPGAAVSCAAV
jgi:hypothetical protein